MATPEKKLQLKLMVDSTTKKVIFAEAGSEFVDVLFSFMTLPLGTIIRQLNKHSGRDMKPLVCLNNLYSSLGNLSDLHFWKPGVKHILLHPTNASETEFRLHNLKLNVDDSEPTRGYRVYSSCNERVFTDSTKSFIITDDLTVIPSLSDGLKFKVIQDIVMDQDTLEERVIDVGFNEIILLVKFSLISMYPLTMLLDSQLKSICGVVTANIMRPLKWLLVFTSTTITNLLLEQLKSEFTKQKPKSLDFGIPTLRTPARETSIKTEEPRKMIIKALVRRSTKSFMFFLAGVDFVEFLFKLFTIPLGTAVSLLGGETYLWGIDHLHKSISEMSSKCFSYERGKVSKEWLLNPKVAHHDFFNNTIQLLSLGKKPCTAGLNLMDLISGEKSLFVSPSTFMVTCGMEVTPLSSMSIVSYLSARKIPISDIEELTLNIGSKEALDILKASLTSSTSALSDALQMGKHPMEEA